MKTAPPLKKTLLHNEKYLRIFLSQFSHKGPFSLRGEKVRACPELDSGMRGDKDSTPPRLIPLPHRGEEACGQYSCKMY